MSDPTDVSALPLAVFDPERLAALGSFKILDTPPEEGFDDIVQLAGLLCDAPVALVSFVANDRQWFKARVGFPRCETDLNSSVCAFALVERDLLVIPDLSADPRTRRNPLVSGEPNIRFYAGAPLRTKAGHVLGSLCVIDHRPRPEGLTQRQATGLRALGRQVVGQLELRRLIHSRDEFARQQHRAQAALQAQRELLQTVTDHLGQAVFQMNAIGHVIFANPMAERMFGYSHAEIIGQNLHELIHHSHPDGSLFPAEDCELRQALIHGELLRDCPQVFFRKDGTPLHALVTNAPVVADGTVESAVLTVTDVTERRAAELRLIDSEAYWRGLFEQLREGLIIGEVIRDASGRVTDWRYHDVNPAWAQLTGLSGADVIGRTAREILPAIEEEWIEEPGYVIDTGETTTFTRQVGELGRWYEGRVSALKDDMFIVLFLDVTDRLRVEQELAAGNQRKAALARLSDHLRTTMSAEAMAHTAAAVSGQTLGASQAAYAVVDAAKGTVLIESSWCARGFARLAGSHSFRDYGSYIEDLKSGRTVIVSDTATDERTRHQADAFHTLGVAAFVNVPVVENDRLVALFVTHFAEPRLISREEEEFVRAAVDRTRVGIARVRAEEQQTILNDELSHRLKNSMAMILAIANQTLKGVTEREIVRNFERRLLALSTAHDVLVQRDWDAADLEEILRRALDVAGMEGRYEAAGPAVRLGSRSALSASLLLHELATNAIKYGALSTPSGAVEVRWVLEGAADAEELVLTWRERGGPPVAAPTQRGFGSRLLGMGLLGRGGSRIDYRDTGLEATFRAPRRQVEQS